MLLSFAILCLTVLAVTLQFIKLKKGYIIYGEIEITMLDFNFEKQWSFSGKDIFASISGKEPFKILENSICLYDFEDNYYEIDFDENNSYRFR